jgi:hypothetical protein
MADQEPTPAERRFDAFVEGLKTATVGAVAGLAKDVAQLATRPTRIFPIDPALGLKSGVSHSGHPMT